MSGRWVDLREAAELLGTTTEAVRKRAARGSLRSDRHDGRVVVWVDEGRTEGGHEPQVDHEPLVEAKDETIRILEEQLRLRAEEIQRRDVIISQLTQANAALAARVPELEAPVTSPSSPQESSGGPPNPGRGCPGRSPAWAVKRLRSPQRGPGGGGGSRDERGPLHRDGRRARRADRVLLLPPSV
jgi:hypothetical protein